MGKTYNSPVAFRMAIEERLRTLHTNTDVPVHSLRLQLAIERLLARLFIDEAPAWLLKGGYSLELRYRSRARTTKDVDLSSKTSAATLEERLIEVRDQLQLACDQPLGDFFQFSISEPTKELQGAPDGGGRFLVSSTLADRVFARFHLDVGFNDPLLSDPEMLEGRDFLAFAGIAPAKVLAIAKSQQFAEKIHAYTKPWTHRPNTRVKDLVDLVLFLTIDPPSAEAIRDAAKLTFTSRGSHPLVKELPPPPEPWQPLYDEMAADLHLQPREMKEGWKLVDSFWRDLWT